MKQAPGLLGILCHAIAKPVSRSKLCEDFTVEGIRPNGLLEQECRFHRVLGHAKADTVEIAPETGGLLRSIGVDPKSIESSRAAAGMKVGNGAPRGFEKPVAGAGGLTSKVLDPRHLVAG